MNTTSRIALVADHLKGSANEIKEPIILFEQKNKVVKATLNTPKTLNALDIPKVDMLEHAITEWNKNSNAKVALFAGNGKAFSAGGDLKKMYQSLHDSQTDPAKLEYLMSSFHKTFILYDLCKNMRPIQVALWNGIVIGGGAGITLSAPIIIATEKATFAIPEVKIGSIPGFISGYYSSRMRNYLGAYLALTNLSFKGKDIVNSGLAHFYVTSDKLSVLEDEIIRSTSDKTNVEDLRRIVKKYAENVSGFVENEELISKVFSKNSVQSILEELQMLQDSDNFAKKLYGIMKSQSPLAMRLAFEQIRRGQQLSFEGSMILDHKMSYQLPKMRDFLIGMESVIINRGKVPAWTHKSVTEVSDKEVNQLLSETSGRELILRSNY